METATRIWPAASERLDITGEVCPMTFVRTKLRLERLPSGTVLEIRLNGGEPLTNVPRAAREHGYVVLEQSTNEDGTHRLRIGKP